MSYFSGIIYWTSTTVFGLILIAASCTLCIFDPFEAIISSNHKQDIEINWMIFWISTVYCWLAIGGFFLTTRRNKQVWKECNAYCALIGMEIIGRASSLARKFRTNPKKYPSPCSHAPTLCWFLIFLPQGIYSINITVHTSDTINAVSSHASMRDGDGDAHVIIVL